MLGACRWPRKMRLLRKTKDFFTQQAEIKDGIRRRSGATGVARFLVDDSQAERIRFSPK